jgi:FKBP-type peptidyl-prolyl cis-trans isomerase SlyD
MGQESIRVDDDLVVSLEYVLRLDDGQEVDRSFGDDPLEFLQGHGHIIPGLEVALYGMAIGDEKEIVVEPEDGYGDYDDESLVTMAREALPQDVALEEGAQIFVRDTDTGEQFQATVAEVQDESILLDFNHPLAGETLHFWVKVTGLRPATAEEIAHGHVHDGSAHEGDEED